MLIELRQGEYQPSTRKRKEARREGKENSNRDTKEEGKEEESREVGEEKAKG